MRGANITAAVAGALWLAYALTGVRLVAGVAARAAPGYPNMAQINAMIVWPFFVIVAVLACAWLCNALQRWEGALILLSMAAIAAFLPYIAIMGGGV